MKFSPSPRSAIQPDRGITYNYDEAQIPPHTLPDPLVSAGGVKIPDASTWIEKRRPELLHLFETQMYGRSPGKPGGMRFELTATDPRVLGGKATRKEVTVYFTGDKAGPRMNLLIMQPNGVQKPLPAFLGLNFEGNQTTHADPGITLPQQWRHNPGDETPTLGLAPESTRGKFDHRWQVEKIIRSGYALVTACYGDIEPDFEGGWKLGVRGALAREGEPTEFQPDAWGAIAAWSWALSRALDYLETDPDIDAERVAVMGHSRLGKAALWAGAQDERFALVISNDSGEGGAALSRRCIGETIARLNRVFPHWFCGNLKQYSDNESALPFDQHELIALIAPRPVYIASAEDDLWADPHGEFLGAKNAEPVYGLLGKAGLGVADMPEINQPVGDFIGYHIRPGVHDVTAYDWEQFIAFARRHLSRDQGNV